MSLLFPLCKKDSDRFVRDAAVAALADLGGRDVQGIPNRWMVFVRENPI